MTPDIEESTKLLNKVNKKCKYMTKSEKKSREFGSGRIPFSPATAV
jgi:hypothetical protein